MVRPKSCVRPLTAAVLCACCASEVLAAPVTYTFAGTATGNIGSQAFSNAAFSINLTANTSDIVFSPSPRLWSVSGLASMTIAGIGTTTLTTPTYLFNNGVVCGLGRTNGPSDIFDVFAPGLTNYGLNTNFGPVQATQVGMNWTVSPVASGLGNIALTSASNVSFRAVVPAPGAIGVLALGGLFATRRRRTSLGC